MAQERIIFNPAEMNTGRTEFEITPWVRVEGINWGDAEMQAYKAEAEIGEDVLDFRLPNRPITMPLVIKDAGGTTFATARSYIQATAASTMREGMIGKRILSTGGTVYFDVVADGLTLSGGFMPAQRNADPDAELRLEAIPDFYEPEELIAEAEEKTAAELIKVIPDPGGDMPARVRIEVIEKQGVDQKALIWAFRSRRYSAASTAKTTYEAEELEALDVAEKTALVNASGGTIVQHGKISTNWTPVLGGRRGGTAFPTHTGINRFFARVYSVSGTLVQTRLVWDVGDLVNPTGNAACRLPGAGNFYIVDLGEVRLDPGPIGTHRWDWQIQARGDGGGEDFKVDKVWIINTDEGMGVLSAPASVDAGLTPYSARSEFNAESGAITGDSLAAGGTWLALANSDTTDFSVAGGVATRTAISDTGTIASSGFPGRAVGAGVSLGSVAACVDIRSTILDPAIKQGLFFRVSNATNFCFAYAQHVGPGQGAVIYTGTVSSGVVFAATAVYIASLNLLTTSRFGISCAGTSLEVTIDGEGAVYSPLVGGPSSGGVYIYDENLAGAAATRTYDNFAVWAPVPDAVIYATRSAQLTTDGMYRLDSGGSAFGPISRVVGDLPRLPGRARGKIY